ncbi:MAG: hypothetical protein KF869_14150 [Phycisphaeraceae bacterium]|nr:hypothetical protein [Phycisphaeraceae bacterium]
MQLMRHAAAALLAGVAAGSMNPSCNGSVSRYDGDPRALVTRLRDAHAGAAGYEIEFRIPIANTAEVAPLLDAAAQVRPEMVLWMDPLSGITFRIAYSGSIVGDGLGLACVRTRTLFLGGPESIATSVEIWQDAGRISIPGIGANSGTLDLFAPLTVEQEAALRARGRVSFESMRAQSEYVALARYAARVLSAVSDLAGPWSTSERDDSVCSPGWGLLAETDRATGELTRAILTDELGVATLYEFRGRHDQPLYPARHPREVRMYELRDFSHTVPPVFPAGSAADLRRVVLFDSARRVDIDSDDQFQWQTFAGQVVDRRADEIVYKDGTRAPAPKRPIVSSAVRSELITFPPTPGERVGVASAPRAARSTLIIAGCSLVLLSAVVWVRRKLQ